MLQLKGAKLIVRAHSFIGIRCGPVVAKTRVTRHEGHASQELGNLLADGESDSRPPSADMHFLVQYLEKC